MNFSCTQTCSGCPDALDRVACRCLNVTEGELVTVIETLGLRTLHEVRRHTDAGNGCTCCHAEIRDLLEKHTSQLAVAG